MSDWASDWTSSVLTPILTIGVLVPLSIPITTVTSTIPTLTQRLLGNGLGTPLVWYAAFGLLCSRPVRCFSLAPPYGLLASTCGPSPSHHGPSGPGSST